jgi:hypothetical protein
MKTVRINLLATLFVVTASALHSLPLSASPSPSGISVIIDTEGLLAQALPRISYTGLAFTAGTIGLCTSYNGFKRLCKGIEEDKRKTKIIGATELSIGLGTTAASIAIIHFLWSR